MNLSHWLRWLFGITSPSDPGPSVMAIDFATRLDDLGFRWPDGHTPPSEELVKAFEKRFRLKLPADYRSFLAQHGGKIGLAQFAVLEPAPFGVNGTIDRFYGFTDDEIADETELIEGAPTVIALGYEPLGKMLWLYCKKPFAGHVFIHDHEGRSAWSDDTFRQRYPSLSLEIENYLQLRRDGKLPKKKRGFENVYLAAKSFSDFMEALKPVPRDE